MICVSECVVILPCLNEADSLRSLIPRVREHIEAVIVIDDGSTDGTGAVAAEMGAELIVQGRRGGKGAALKAGWGRAWERGFRWALSMDGDGQHSPDDIPRFLACEEGVGLVVGNRMGDASAMPWLRRRVNRWMSRRLSRVAGRDLPDSQCGFRLMRLDAWSSLTLVTAHYEIESEVLLAFVAAGERVEFVPIKVIYRDESSKIQPVRDTVRWFRWFGRHLRA